MKNIIRCLRLVLPIAPGKLAVYFMLSLPSAIIPAILLYLEKYLIDNVSGEIMQMSFYPYILPVVMMVTLYSLMKAFDVMAKQHMEFNYFSTILLQLTANIHRKMSKLPLEDYESAITYRKIDEGKDAVMFIAFTANMVIICCFMLINLMATGGYLAKLHPLLILFVFLVSFPVVLEKYKASKEQAILMKANTQPAREKKYALSILLSSTSKKEVSLQGSGKYIADKYLLAAEQSDDLEEKTNHKLGKAGIFYALLKSCFRVGSLILITFLFLTGRITIGGFAAVLTSFTVLSRSYTTLFDFLGDLTQMGIMSEPYFSLTEAEATNGMILPSINKEVLIQFDHVTYQYPGSNRPALKDISFTLRQGESLAIVGMNGAGKTTLTKLMSGLLKPTSGQIFIHGVNRDDLTDESILSTISAIYQEYGRYNLSVADNVFISDSRKPYNHDHLLQALNWADLQTFASSDPRNTMLGKEFNGIDLSGGQWQRIAMARCYYRNRSFVFMDEPTAAIDPLQEVAYFAKIQEMAKEKTVVTVMHRLGSVRNADRILVLNAAEMDEIGSFNELIEKKGTFYYIWNEQKKWYNFE